MGGGGDGAGRELLKAILATENCRSHSNALLEFPSFYRHSTPSL